MVVGMAADEKTDDLEAAAGNAAVGVAAAGMWEAAAGTLGVVAAVVGLTLVLGFGLPPPSLLFVSPAWRTTL